MNIVTRQVKDNPLTVIIEYPEYNDRVAGLIRKIDSLDISFTAGIDDRQVRISLSDVYYIESVDRKVFIYTSQDVYRLDPSMAMPDAIKDTALVRISRICIMNTDHLKEIRQVRNSRLEALLDNGEKLIVSRKYLKDIKRVFQKGYV